MADDRYNRWQAAATGQLTVAVALVSAFSLGGLGLGATLLKEKDFVLAQPFGLFFAGAMLLLFLAAAFSTFAVISRLLDFRLTARSVRKKRCPGYAKPLVMFGVDADGFGRLTWQFFWSSILCFGVGAVLLVASLSSFYAHRLV